VVEYLVKQLKIVESTRPIGKFSSIDIGIIDSGVGGLSVAQELKVLEPNLRLGYIADTALFPYGDKSVETLIPRMRHFVSLFSEIGTRVVVIACNTASSASLSDLRVHFNDSVRIVGMEPPLKPAAQHSLNRSVAVIATSGTVSGDSLTDLKQRFASDIAARFIAAPGLADCVERGQMTDGEIDVLIGPIVQEIIKHDVDSVALGCSHYSFLMRKIRDKFPSNIKFFDAALPVARRAIQLFGEITKDDINAFNQCDPVNVFLTGSKNTFEETVRKLEESDCTLPEIKIKLDKLEVPNV
jgi:glutamate racemase|tara:strand:- start:1457 stop:2350 length:894 start_codon:yes stop_codon:yes gene_type:complete